MSGARDMPHASRTDVGRRREHNEDAILDEPPLIAVADGVGGSAKGEVASRTALDTFVGHAAAVASAPSSREATIAMDAAVQAANAAVHRAQQRDESLRGMATTLSGAVVRDGGEVIVGHVGDSRLYVVSAAGARQATEDHSVVAELVRSGRLDQAEVSTHPQRNVITRALGPEPEIAVDAFVLHVGPGDWLLACSDGLTEHVDDEELAQAVLAHASSPDAAVGALVDLANERGGTDNISVVVAQPVPSDVSGELSIESLQAAAASTAQLERAPAHDAPADASGPMPAVDATNPRDAGSSLPPLEPLTRERPPRQARTAHPTRRMVARWLLALTLLVLAAAAGGFLWSRSYFLVERPDGAVGIDRGFPVAGLSTPHRSSDVLADELAAADRERLVESRRLLDREDAERVLASLPERIDGGGAGDLGEVDDGDAPGA